MGLVAMTSTTARAGDVALPRVPPTFTDGACLVVAEPGDLVTLGLSVPYEDTTSTADEPADSRSLQFFATCRDREPAETMPAWLDDADVTATAEVDPGLESPADVDVLARSPQWQGPGHDGEPGGCVVTIDADRRPITCEAAASPLQWDTTGVAPGGYVVWGYTYQPTTSLWTRRPGAVWVDGPEAGPVVALTHPFGEATVGVDTGLRVRGCAAGQAGTTYALEWITAAELERGQPWGTTSSVLLDDGVVDLDWWPDASLVYEAVFLRVRGRDPAGRTFVSAPAGPVVVLDGAKAPTGGSPPWADGCDDLASPWPPTSAARRSNTDDTDDDVDENPAIDDDDPAAGEDVKIPSQGCGMAPTGRGGLLWALWGLAAIAGRRRP